MKQNTHKDLNATMDYILFCFLFCSILGWCLEVTWRSIRRFEIYIPSFLFGPYCPIYGVGMILIIVFGKTSRKITCFFKIVILMSVLEYLISFIFETAFDQLLWDYSNVPLHIGTRVCISFSIIWGVLGIIGIIWLEPKLNEIYFKYRKLFRQITYVGIIIISIDTVYSIIIVR